MCVCLACLSRLLCAAMPYSAQVLGVRLVEEQLVPDDEAEPGWHLHVVEPGMLLMWQQGRSSQTISLTVETVTDLVARVVPATSRKVPADAIASSPAARPCSLSGARWAAGGILMLAMRHLCSQSHCNAGWAQESRQRPHGCRPQLQTRVGCTHQAHAGYCPQKACRSHIMRPTLELCLGKAWAWE